MFQFSRILFAVSSKICFEIFLFLETSLNICSQILFNNNSSEDFLKKFRHVTELSEGQIFEKKLFSKKKTKLYTNYAHYQNFNLLLN